MKKFLLIALGLCVAGTAFAMSDIYVSGTWRYRVTVEIQTPEGLKSGSAVHEVSNSASSVKIIDLPEAGNPPEFKGEAVVVDLGKRGVVFAVLPTDPYYMFYNTFPNPNGASTAKGIRYYNTLKNGDRRQLALKDYPMFVMFKDMNDPKSVTLVWGTTFDPEKQQHVLVDDFGKIFGEGVHIKDITIEITDDPVTRGIEKYLPWVSKLQGHNIDGTHFTSSAQLSNTLHEGNFEKGAQQ